MTQTQQPWRRSRAGMLLTAVALIAIGVATLTPSQALQPVTSFPCIICGERGLADALMNVMLFAPLGVALAITGVRARSTVLVGTIVSACVEVAQLTIVPGRYPSIGDVVFNTLGTVVGLALVWLTRAVTELDARSSARLSIAAALDVVLAVLLTGWLLQPSFPLAAYWGQWTPNLGHLEWYRGRIREARVAGRVVPSRRVEHSAWAREALLRGDTVEVTFVAGPPVRRLASLFSIYDQRRREIFLVGPDRDDLVLRFRTRAAAWRLDQPDLRALGAWRGLGQGGAYTLTAWAPSRGEWCMDGPVERQCELGFTVGAGWGILFYVESFPRWLKDGLALGWLAAMLLPTGFFLRHRWESAVASAIVVTAFAVLPPAMALRPTRAIEWVGVALGLGVGAIAARVLGRRQTGQTAPSTPRGGEPGEPGAPGPECPPAAGTLPQ